MEKTNVPDKNIPLKVTGISKDVPSHSHLEFDMVISLENYIDNGRMTTWIINAIYIYVKLSSNVDQASIAKQISTFREKYMGGDIHKYGFNFTLLMTLLKDVYFKQ